MNAEVADDKGEAINASYTYYATAEPNNNPWGN